MDAIWGAETGIIAGIQAIGDWLTLPATAVSALGGELFYLAALPLLLWCVNAGLGARLSVFLTAGAAVNALCTILAHAPRPYWYSVRVQPLAMATTFGLPTAQAQLPVTLWGYLALKTRWRWAVPAALAAAILIAFSGVYLGTHFLTAVLAGMALGVAALWLILRYETTVLAWWRGRALRAQVGLALAASLLAPLAAVAWQTVVHSQWSAPQAWTGGIPPEVTAASMERVFLVAGAMFGALAGLSVLAARGWYSAAGSLVSRAARYVIGITILVLFLVAFQMTVPDTQGILTPIRDYLCYAVVAGWISLGAPELFIALKLAQRPAETHPSPPPTPQQAPPS
ncbi:phosphatase PAP2 family protein [Salinactinospora qingdaonensis]|uniref:Phosphatidic acid phosphatase type 2/haloperoxidase domain-containing protein n=1 Tax=Salinactinospora qingdaonensis TaxID=702744 RepID=A0ABP7FSJ7_9ACTN